MLHSDNCVGDTRIRACCTQHLRCLRMHTTGIVIMGTHRSSINIAKCDGAPKEPSAGGYETRVHRWKEWVNPTCDAQDRRCSCDSDRNNSPTSLASNSTRNISSPPSIPSVVNSGKCIHFIHEWWTASFVGPKIIGMLPARPREL